MDQLEHAIYKIDKVVESIDKNEIDMESIKAMLLLVKRNIFEYAKEN